MRFLTGDDNDFQWPVEKTVALTLDLECDYGTALETNTYEAAKHTPKLRSFLEEYDVPLTCFLQTELLEEAPEVVKTLQQASVPTDFHAHSHTHPHPKHANFEEELDASLKLIEDRFSNDVVGYRFPDGAIPTNGYKMLADRNVDFSSSLFPTWRPGRFDNLDRTITPHEPLPGLTELPLTPFSSVVRIPVSISYLKLLGGLYQKLVSRYPPDVIIFDIHMHDLTTPSTISSLSLPYRMIYERNREHGYSVLSQFVEALQERGYRFETMSKLYMDLKTTPDSDSLRAGGKY